MESMQAVIPPSMTSGWNDPPNLGGATPPVASHRLAQLRKRPVDPSLSGVSGGNMAQQLVGNGQNYASHQYYGASGNGYGATNANPVPVSPSYGFVPSSISVGIPTSTPIPGVVTTHATTDFRDYTQHCGSQDASVPLTTLPNQLPPTGYSQIAQQPQQPQFMHATPSNNAYQQREVPSHPHQVSYPYGQGEVQSSSQTPSEYMRQHQYKTTLPNAQSNHDAMRNDGSVNQQFFQQQQYHGAPPNQQQSFQQQQQYHGAPPNQQQSFQQQQQYHGAPPNQQQSFQQQQQQYHGAPPNQQQSYQQSQPYYGAPPIRSVTDKLRWAATSFNTSAATSSSTTSSGAPSPGVITTISSSSPTMPSSSTKREAHRPIYDIFTVARGSSAGVKSVDPFLARNNSTPNQLTTQVAWTASSSELTGTTKTSPSLSLKAPRSAASLDSTFPLPIHPNDVIASLPNCVVDLSRRPSTHEGVNYRPVAKAPGDVSMSRQQIILCLSTASEKLSPNIHQGVQLRISELKEAMDEGRISERCLKSLNYVVDAIDRENYDDALIFFDRLRMEFPDEMGPWAQQGIRLLINELRRPVSRIGSAGRSIHT